MQSLKWLQKQYLQLSLKNSTVPITDQTYAIEGGSISNRLLTINQIYVYVTVSAWYDAAVSFKVHIWSFYTAQVVYEWSLHARRN